jgi:light-regulated signal transduction histidine kinase (bacteriophytochrome)
MQRIVERAVIMADDGQLDFILSSGQNHNQNASSATGPSQDYLLTSNTLNLTAIEEIAVEKALRKNTGNVSHAAKPTGSGIGLALARQIMHKHRGAIQVSSEIDKGSQFRLIF